MAVAAAKDKRAYNKAYHAAHREKHLDQMRRWNRENRARRRASSRAHYARNREKLRAQSRARDKTAKGRAIRAVRYALARGDIIKPTHCPECGAKPLAMNMHAHHDDYSKPLDVRWLCVQCHGVTMRGD